MATPWEIIHFHAVSTHLNCPTSFSEDKPFTFILSLPQKTKKKGQNGCNKRGALYCNVHAKWFQFWCERVSNTYFNQTRQAYNDWSTHCCKAWMCDNEPFVSHLECSHVVFVGHTHQWRITHVFKLHTFNFYYKLYNQDKLGKGKDSSVIDVARLIIFRVINTTIKIKFIQLLRQYFLWSLMKLQVFDKDKFCFVIILTR